MRLRSQRHSHVEALTLTALLLASTPAPALPLGSEKELGSNGALHSIIVENRIVKNRIEGTRLVDYAQSANGTVTPFIVPGTDEAAIEADPSVSILPGSGLAVLAWSRWDGPDYEILVSLFDGSRWGAPIAVTVNSFDDRRPQVIWGRSGYVHLVWAGPVQTDGSPSYYQAVLDSKGTPVVLPTLITLAAEGSVSETTAAAVLFSTDDRTFGVDSSTMTLRRFTCYGGMDEPIPIVHRLDFALPSGSEYIRWVKTEAVGSSVLALARAGTKLWYSIQLPSGWTPLRAVSLDSMTEERAEILIKSMVRKNGY